MDKKLFERIFDLSKPVIALRNAMYVLDSPISSKELKQQANNCIGYIRDAMHQ